MSLCVNFFCRLSAQANAAGPRFEGIALSNKTFLRTLPWQSRHLNGRHGNFYATTRPHSFGPSPQLALAVPQLLAVGYSSQQRLSACALSRSRAACFPDLGFGSLLLSSQSQQAANIKQAHTACTSCNLEPINTAARDIYRVWCARYSCVLCVS